MAKCDVCGDGEKIKIEMLRTDRAGKEQVLMAVSGERVK